MKNKQIFYVFRNLPIIQPQASFLCPLKLCVYININIEMGHLSECLQTGYRQSKSYILDRQ